jgi:hypothetical protein
MSSVENIISGGVEKQVIVDHERVEHVLGRLMVAYEANEYPYNLPTTVVPHDHRNMPEMMEFGSREHAMFLFNACYYMRGGIRSVDAFQRMTDIYNWHPSLFITNDCIYASAVDVAEVLTANGLGFTDTVSDEWMTNTERLHERWGGDPRNIFDGVTDYGEALQRIRNDQKGGGFIGFQEKMVSMITYYLMDEGMIDFFQFPLPVDLHVLRITLANELLRFEGYADDENLYTDGVQKIVRNLYYRYAVDNNISTLSLCNAVWLFSEALCGKQPGNITLEPNGRKNREGRNTLLVPGPVKPEDPRQRLQYFRACGQCVIEQTCEWNVPGKPYYVKGELIKRDRRFRFPDTDVQNLLPLAELEV